MIEIAVTPNRGDALSVRGVARDLAAAGLGTLKPWAPQPVTPAYPAPLRWEIEDPRACLWVLGRAIRGVRNGPSPKWLQDRLTAIGLRPINALVDVTNPEEAKVREALWRRGDGLAVEVEPMYPVYDPGRKRGAFVGREPRGQALYVLEPGRVPRRLEPGRFDPKVASLALSPDGRFVVFCADRTR